MINSTIGKYYSVAPQNFVLILKNQSELEQHNKHFHWRVQLDSHHLIGHTKEFRPRTQKQNRLICFLLKGHTFRISSSITLLGQTHLILHKKKFYWKLLRVRQNFLHMCQLHSELKFCQSASGPSRSLYSQRIRLLSLKFCHVSLKPFIKIYRQYIKHQVVSKQLPYRTKQVFNL